MNEASAIPSILEKLKRSNPSNSAGAYLVAQDAVSGFADIVDRLAIWNQSFQASSEHPLSWYREVDGEMHLWFSNITTATCLTYLWAFWIICVSRIRQFRADFPSLREYEVGIHGQVPENAYILQEVIQLSIWILGSVQFFMKDEMKLFGVSSVSFPLHTALEVLNTVNDSSVATCSKSYQNIIERFTRRGYQDIFMSWGAA